MEKVLLVTLNSCYPLHHGGALAQYYFLDGLKDSVELVLCTEVHNEKELRKIHLLQEKQPNLKVFYTKNYHPTSKNTFKKKLKNFLQKVTKFFLGKKTILNIPCEDDFQDSYFGHVDSKFSLEFVIMVNNVIINENINQVQFDFYDTMDLCFAIPENVKKIFVHHELRFKRLKLASDKSFLPSCYKNYLIAKTEVFERACLRAMDYVLVFNHQDAELLRPDCKEVIVSPFAIPDELIFNQPQSKVFNKFMFVGAESHTPNLLGLKWFLDEIYIPHMDEIEFPLYVVGNWSAGFRNQYKAYPKITFCGIVESLETYFQESVFVNPILTGAGLRTKVLHALVNKVPVLSTGFGAEGCFEENNKSHLGIFESAEDFLNIIKNENFSDLAEKGYKYYIESFNKEKLLGIRKAIFEQHK